MNNMFGHQLRILHWCMDQTLTAAVSEMELTAAQGQILGYLAHRSSAPCFRDIEEDFHLSHPTVSGLLSRLEKKGFIAFYPDEADRRCKRIRLESKGRQCVAAIGQTIFEIEGRFCQGFTPAEQAQFHEFLNRAIANLESKEEPEHHD